MTEHPTDAKLFAVAVTATKPNATGFRVETVMDFVEAVSVDEAKGKALSWLDGEGLAGFDFSHCNAMEAAKPSTPIDERLDQQKIAEVIAVAMDKLPSDETVKGAAIAVIARINGPMLRAATEALGQSNVSPAIDDEGLVERLREALQVCANKFWEYVILHQDKKTPDGDEKAARNQEMAEMCEKAISNVS